MSRKNINPTWMDEVHSSLTETSYILNTGDCHHISKWIRLCSVFPSIQNHREAFSTYQSRPNQVTYLSFCQIFLCLSLCRLYGCRSLSVHATVHFLPSLLSTQSQSNNVLYCRFPCRLLLWGKGRALVAFGSLLASEVFTGLQCSWQRKWTLR